jgi:hypothetical protein
MDEYTFIEVEDISKLLNGTLYQYHCKLSNENRILTAL